MSDNIDKPTPEKKALSLYLMAFKSKKPLFKDQSNRINKQWGLVKEGQLSNKDYLTEVHKILKSHGGYQVVLEKTVRHYIKKTGEWKLEGDDKYCKDARKFADTLLTK